MKKTFILENRESSDNIKANQIIQKMILPESIKSKILKYQEPHIKNMCYALMKNRIAIDASDTGTGKTYCSLAICKATGLRPFIICPKPVITSWQKVSDFIGVNPYMIINYDTIRTGNLDTPFLKLVNKQKDLDYGPDVKVVMMKKNNIPKSNTMHYIWNLPKDCILIFDEAHKCKNNDTMNSMLLQATKDISNKVMLLSATLVDRPENFAVFGYVLGLSDNLYNMKKYISSFPNEKVLSIKIHEMIFPERGSRLRIKDLGNAFPDNKVIPESFYMAEVTKEINEKYKEIDKCLEDLKNKEIKDKANLLTKMLRARQRIEILKLPTIARLIIDHQENGLSVVVFLNFNESIQILSKHLQTNSLIVGGQTQKERDKIIQDFQENRNRLIICNSQSGGTGISLHDLNGNYPRVSLISPNWSSIIFTQILGRIYRAGGKSKVLQKIVFCGGSIEERIAKKVQQKLQNLTLINDGDLI